MTNLDGTGGIRINTLALWSSTHFHFQNVKYGRHIVCHDLHVFETVSSPRKCVFITIIGVKNSWMCYWKYTVLKYIVKFGMVSLYLYTFSAAKLQSLIEWTLVHTCLKAWTGNLAYIAFSQ